MIVEMVWQECEALWYLLPDQGGSWEQKLILNDLRRKVLNYWDTHHTGDFSFPSLSPFLLSYLISFFLPSSSLSSSFPTLSLPSSLLNGEKRWINQKTTMKSHFRHVYRQPSFPYMHQIISHTQTEASAQQKLGGCDPSLNIYYCLHYFSGFAWCSLWLQSRAWLCCHLSHLGHCHVATCQSVDFFTDNDQSQATCQVLWLKPSK